MTWQVGRALVYDEAGEVEYFLRFEDDSNHAEPGPYVRTFCGGLRPISKCRPLDYMCDVRYLKRHGAAYDPGR